MNLQLKTLKLTDIYGQKELCLEFGDITIVSGDSKAGKTNVINSYLWLITGKDSQGRHNSDIKPTTTEWSNINPCHSTVEADFDHNGSPLSLMRSYREFYTKGSEKLSGHKTIYQIDGVDKSEAEYNAFIKELFGSDDIFKQLSNPLYFPAMPADKQGKDAMRAILTQIAGEVSVEELNGGEFLEFISTLNGKSLVEFRTGIAAKLKPLNTELDQIAPKIKEEQHTMPEMVDTVKESTTLAEKQQKLSAVESQITSADEAVKPLREKRTQELLAINTKKEELRNAEDLHARKSSAELDLEFEISNIQRDNEAIAIRNARAVDLMHEDNKKITERNEKKAKEYADGQIELEKIKEVIAEQKDKRENLLTQLEEIGARVFNADHCECCGAELLGEQLEVNRAKFNSAIDAGITDIKKKISDLSVENEATRARGLELKAMVQPMPESLVSGIDVEALKDVETLKQKLSDIQKNRLPFSETEKAKALQAEIAELEKNLTIVEAPDTTALVLDRKTLLDEISALKETITKAESVADQIKKQTARIAELNTQSKIKSQAINELKQQEFTAKNFQLAQMAEVEKRVRDKFPTLGFTMFSTALNGEVNEECIVTDSIGVPWAMVNTGHKTLNGLGAIDTLSRHYGMKLPIFIDDAVGVNSQALIDASEGKQVIILKRIDNQKELQTIKIK